MDCLNLPRLDLVFVPDVHNVLQTSMLVGLHTCGDLCSNLLRLFCSSDVIKSMCCVGCCYHHITEPECMAVNHMLSFFIMYLL